MLSTILSTRLTSVLTTILTTRFTSVSIKFNFFIFSSSRETKKAARSQNGSGNSAEYARGRKDGQSS
jgi:hypothetical protein